MPVFKVWNPNGMSPIAVYWQCNKTTGNTSTTIEEEK